MKIDNIERKKIEHFTDIDAWVSASELIMEIYEMTKKFPNEELYGLTSQVKRASISITSNIAEAMGRFSYKDRIRFLYNSRGSLYEVENLVIIALKLGLIKGEQEYSMLKGKIATTGKLLNGFINSTERLMEIKS